jgi:hypothetical protein
MSNIDLGNTPTGTPPTAEEQAQLRVAMGVGVDGVQFTSIIDTLGDISWYDYDNIPSVYEGTTTPLKLYIGNKVRTINDNAFDGLFRVTNGFSPLTLPDSIASIGAFAFRLCDAFYEDQLRLPRYVETIGERAFENCINLRSQQLVLPRSITEVGDYVFVGCNLGGGLTLPNTNVSYGIGAFSACGLTGGLVLPDNMTIIPDHMFQNNAGLTSITLGSLTETIGNEAFRGCNGITGELIIPDLVTSIGEASFSAIDDITKVTIGSSMSYLGEMAFFNCTSLSRVDCFAQVAPSHGNMVFLLCNIAEFHVPIGATGYTGGIWDAENIIYDL